MKPPEGPRQDAPQVEQEGAAEQIHSRLRELTERMVNNPMLDAIERGELTQAGWREFATQRYLAALHFEALLAAGMKKAADMGDTKLTDTLASNLRDEQGIDTQGQPLPTGSHEKWRQDFYHALGLDHSTLEGAQPTDGAKEYDETLQRFIDDEDALTVAGALLVQEFSIPEEFKRIKVGRDLTFPDQFVIQDKDTSTQRRQKGFARLYIDHHIAHDATSHYPDLERALATYYDDPQSVAKIMKGMEIMSEAKKKFYESLQTTQEEKRSQ